MLAQRDDGSGEPASFGLLSSLIALIVIFLWLEWGPQRGAAWVWLPLALPALPLVTGQYAIALHLGLDGDFIAVLWGHLLWVLPWMLLVLQPPAAIDPGLSLPPERSAGGGQKFLPAEMSPAGASCAAGLCHRLFRQHGPIYADPVAGRGAFRHADHRDRRAQQRRQHPGSR